MRADIVAEQLHNEATRFDAARRPEKRGQERLFITVCSVSDSLIS
jgi:hypothetical protein